MGKKEKKQTLHILTRVSTKPQTKKYGLGIQKNQGIRFSKKLGFNYKVYEERGVSGTLPIEERTGLSQILEGVMTGDVKHIWVKDLTRLSRNNMVSMTISHQLEKYGCRLYTETGEMDFTDSTTDLLYSIVSTFGSWENKVRRKKSMEGKVKHFQSGGWRGGTFPFGYKSMVVDNKKMLFINQDESKWVKKIFEWYDTGKSTTWIGKELDKNGITPRRSKLWNIGSIQSLLRNDLYIGRDEMIDNITDPTKPKKLTYESDRLQIIDKELFYRVRRKVEKSRPLQVLKLQKKYDVLLRGKIVCGDCGSVWRTRINKKKNENLFYCPSKENDWRQRNKKKLNCSIKRSMNIKKTEQIVWGTLCDVLQNSHLVKEHIKGTTLTKKLRDEKDVKVEVKRLRKLIKDTNKSITEMDERIEELYIHYTIGKITKDQREKIEEKVLDTKRELTLKVQEYNTEITNVNEKLGWISWLDKHNKWIKDLSKVTTYKKRLEILNQYIENVIVDWDKKQNKHKISIRLKLPIYKDRYIKKPKGYKLEEGSYRTEDVGLS